MAHVGEELRFGAVRRLGLFLGGLQVHLRPLALGDVGGDCYGATRGRRRHVNLKRPSTTDNRSLEACGFALLVIGDFPFDQVVPVAWAEVAALSLIA